jgi:hypothetical protein
VSVVNFISTFRDLFALFSAVYLLDFQEDDFRAVKPLINDDFSKHFGEITIAATTEVSIVKYRII